jgi:NitT/TauT family transport system substrate-binding protein
LIPDVIVFSESVVRDRPQEIQAFLQTWFEAVERWKANPDEGSAVIAKTLNLDPKTVSLEGIQLLGMAENLTTFQPGADSQSIVYTAQLYMNAFAQMGSLKRPIQLDKFLEPRFVKALANQMPSE